MTRTTSRMTLLSALALTFGLMIFSSGTLACEEECTVGSEACACTTGGACDPGLECRSDLCVQGATGGGSDFCQSYFELCSWDPDVARDLPECHDRCAGGDLAKADMTIEKCWFTACAVETGWCDNEEPDDASILACGVAHGWY